MVTARQLQAPLLDNPLTNGSFAGCPLARTQLFGAGDARPLLRDEIGRWVDEA
jgi:hypothetical protein